MLLPLKCQTRQASIIILSALLFIPLFAFGQNSGSHKPPPPPPPPSPFGCEWKIAEEMPRFPGCDDETMSEKEKKKCSEEKLVDFIYSQLEYPSQTCSSDIQGTVVISFIVEKDGRLTDVKLVRDIGEGCGEEAMRIIKLMQAMPERWSPAKQKGRPVRIKYNIPVKFKQDNTK